MVGLAPICHDTHTHTWAWARAHRKWADNFSIFFLAKLTITETNRPQSEQSERNLEKEMRKKKKIPRSHSTIDPKANGWKIVDIDVGGVVCLMQVCYELSCVISSALTQPRQHPNIRMLVVQLCKNAMYMSGIADDGSHNIVIRRSTTQQTHICINHPNWTSTVTFLWCVCVCECSECTADCLIGVVDAQDIQLQQQQLRQQYCNGNTL